MQAKDGIIYTSEAVSPNMERTPEGYLLCKGVTISRVGTFTYLADEVPTIKPSGGVVRMSRTPDELFSENTMRSFEGKPVVIGHDDFADPSNWSDVSVGIVLNVRRESDDLVADLLITKSDAIETIESGKLREVSCGYEAEAVDDGNGCGHQVGIVGNHLALVDHARCGSACKIQDGIMNDDLIQTLRTAFENGDREGFEAALASLSQPETDEEPEEAEAEEAKESPEQAPEEQAEETPAESVEDEADVPPVDAGMSAEERIAVLEHEYQEMAQKLAKLLEVEQAEGHEELQQDEAPDPDELAASAAETKEVMQDADELCPGIKKPMADSAGGAITVGALKRLKRSAIKSCGSAFGDAATLDGDALDVAFKACLAIARSKRNPSAKIADGTPAQIMSINARNAAFWSGR